MYKDHRILALIPARGGSKGIKKKNIAQVNGLPLIAYTINAVKESSCFDPEDIIVSTDSEEIAETARQFGASAPFRRPKELAADRSDPEQAISHALKTLAIRGREYDILVFLQPTSPLRTARDIQGSLDLFIENRLTSLASVSPAVEHPVFMRTLSPDGRLHRIVPEEGNARRQDVKDMFYLNGAIYINRIVGTKSNWRGNNNEFAFVMNPINGFEVDCPRDLHSAEIWLSLPGTARE